MTDYNVTVGKDLLPELLTGQDGLAKLVENVLNKKAAAMRNRNIQEIKEHGRMDWQKIRQYGRRNLSELGVQRYQRILGYMMHARSIERQKQEAMIGCGVINKMTSLGMPVSYRSA